MLNGKTARALYTELESRRQPFLDRARDAAVLTIPSLLPGKGHSSTSRLPTPFQGLGARGVNNLASKLLLSLLPPNTPFFRLQVNKYRLAELGGVETAKSEVEESLASIEREVMAEVETSAIRTRAFEALKHLIACGNTLVYLPDEGGMRVFHIDQYVIDRDPMGNVDVIVTKETVSPYMLPDAIRAEMEARQSDEYLASRDKSIDLFTCVHRIDADTFAVWQEVCGCEMNTGTYKADSNPYIPLRWSHISNEAYGRGHVEEYIGDIQSLEGLTQAIVEGSAAAARVLFLIRPNSTVREEDLARKPNGGFASGEKDDVSVLSMEKYNDFRIAFDTSTRIETRLEFAFLLNTAIQRNAERVTAEEIRFMAQELEDALGGVYSILSQEFQLPLVRRLLAQMTKAKKIPPLPDEKTVRVAIVTGIDALGRGHELSRLQSALGLASQILGPESVNEWLNQGEVLTRILTGAGVEKEGLIRSEEDVTQSRNQAQIAALANRVGPQAVQQVGGMAAQAAAAQQQ